MKKLILSLFLLASFNSAIAYTLNASNSVTFTYNQKQYALAVVQDDLGINSLVLGRIESGQFLAYAPYIDSNVTTASITNQYGSIYNYLSAMLPAASNLLQQVILPKKPSDASDKVANMAYDIAMNIRFDPTTNQFVLNSPSPLAHAR